MAALVVSMQPHDFGDLTQREDNDPSPIAIGATNDREDESMKTSTDAPSVESIPSLDMAERNDQEDLPVRIDASKTTFGGLENLGNTCYLNSALQMIASLEGFRRSIEEKVPEESKLREELLKVLHALQNGETVRPEELKNEIDERSPLFVGYRQQDSHEFLTALLDLLDDDYKKKFDEQMEEASSVEDSDEVPVHENDETAPSPVKKQRLGDDPVVALSPPTLPTAPSFKDLKFSDIEDLLHGSGSSSPETIEAVERQEPKCKLVGGRMNASSVSLDQLDTECMTDASSSPLKASVGATEDENEGTPASPVDSYFTTEVRVCLTCESCKYRRSHKETYLHLSLELGDNSSSIDEGLRKFFAPEKREIKCEKCFHESATQTMEITKLPKAMLFHLKRFIVDVSEDYTSISYSKDQSPVTFEEDLTLLEGGVLHDFLAVDAVLPLASNYHIRSVVNHIGSSASCGHYTADAKRLQSWTRFNDSYVTSISSADAVEQSSSTAYMILYEME